MRSSAYCFLFFTVMAIGCSQTEKNVVAKVKLQKLSEADIYNREMVFDVIFDSQELKADSIRNASRQAFLKGVDLYKNKKDPAGAVSLFRQSILIFPDAKTYYEMGNALMEDKNNKASLDNALSAFDVADYLNFKPLGMVYYKKASVHNLLFRMHPENISDNIYDVVNNLDRAFDNGFSDLGMIVKDENLKEVTDTKEYKEMLSRRVASKTVSENLFELYKSSFQAYNQPFEISLEDVGNTTNKQSVSYDFAKYIPEMQNTNFGREVSHDYFYVAKIAETPAYTALIYSSISFWGENMQPVYTKLVTYDNDGNIIAAKLFAGQFSAEKVKTGKINNNEITLQDYKRTWKQPIDKVPFDENEVDKYELVATATFKLTDAGDIVEVSVPANYSDSVVFAKK